ncbi:MAG: UDP-N-acetylglucosamine--N-acetylmuramyl-(pentapeptide) pyrophosphoryl-undecaprenol N-acetylglucosamine transferase [Firmicutes bacterium]|nr:UDP-N-acetylglucosamine--N-acetylmuramyl-(pentapeptide) pyrophosphoryl-undecaprenol N-acetylglucosamine transferase [Bacillota bacterium]
MLEIENGLLNKKEKILTDNHAQSKIIVLTGGGTAGHVIPNLALLPYLEQTFGEIHYIGSENGIEREILKKYPQIKYHVIPTAKLRRSISPKSLASNIKTPFIVLSGIRSAKKILRKIKPSIIFSKGGFVAYPVVKAGSSLNIPIILHESDLSLGLANKLSLKHADFVFTSFEKTAQNLCKKLNPDRVKFTGTPIRNEIFKGRAEQITKIFSNSKTTSTKKNLLVIGGSLGAGRINAALQNSLQFLDDWNVLHITGRGKLLKKTSSANYCQIEYLDNPADAYAWADLVISRAGSGAIFELLALNKPTLLIPLSTGRGDQQENAKEVSSKKLMNVLQEENLTPETLFTAIKNTYKDFDILQSSMKKHRYPTNAKEIAEKITAII